MIWRKNWHQQKRRGFICGFYFVSFRTISMSVYLRLLSVIAVKPTLLKRDSPRRSVTWSLTRQLRKMEPVMSGDWSPMVRKREALLLGNPLCPLPRSRYPCTFSTKIQFFAETCGMDRSHDIPLFFAGKGWSNSNGRSPNRRSKFDLKSRQSGLQIQ